MNSSGSTVGDGGVVTGNICYNGKDVTFASVSFTDFNNTNAIDFARMKNNDF